MVTRFSNLVLFASGLALGGCSGALIRTADDGAEVDTTQRPTVPASQELLIAALGDRVVEIATDGTVAILHRVESGQIDALAARGGRIAIAGRDGPEGPWVLLMDRGGRELWRFDAGDESYWLSELALLADGTLIIDLVGAYIPDRLIARRPDGTLHEIADVYVHGLAWEAGLVPVQLASDTGGDMVLWSALTGELRPLAYVPTDQTRWSFWRAMAGGAAIYVTDLAGDLQLVVEWPHRTDLIDIPEIEGLSVFDTHEAGWVLLRNWDSDAVVWVDVINHEVRSADLMPPTGLEVLYPYEGPQLDSRGGLLIGLRDSNVAALYRSTDADSWERIGPTVDQILDIEAKEINGTYIAHATSMRYAYQEWPEDSLADVSGDAIQISRPATGFELSLPPPTSLACLSSYDELGIASPSTDGRRVALWQPESDGNARLELVNTGSGQRTIVLTGIDLLSEYGSCAGRARLVWTR